MPVAELDSHVALLPAVLQSEDSVSLVDHLSGVFSEEDWANSAKCSKFSATAQLSKQPPAGWLHFQELLQQGTKLATAPSHQQDLNSALGRMQENLVSIQQTTCIPLAESSKVSLVSGLNTADSLQMLRCSVCHSLLLSAAFNKHLPSCRPCSVPNKTSKSKLTQPSNGRAASAGHKASSQGKGKKKAQSKGSKKPPAGPSRFAMEQTKAGMQQAVTRSLQGDASVEVRGNVSHAQPGMMPSSTEPLLAPRGQSEVHPASELEGAVKECSQSQTEAPGTRLAWTYEPCMSRSNPDLDAVNDPDLPPRFPHSVCRVARRRSRSASQELPHFLAAEAERPAEQHILQEQHHLQDHGNPAARKRPHASVTQLAAHQASALQAGPTASQHPQANKQQRQHARSAAAHQADTVQQQAPDAAMLRLHQQSARRLQHPSQQYAQNGAPPSSVRMVHEAEDASAQQEMGTQQSKPYFGSMQYPCVQQQIQQSSVYNAASLAVPAAKAGPQSPVYTANQHAAAVQTHAGNTSTNCALSGQQQQQQRWLQQQQQQYQASVAANGYFHSGQQSVPWQTDTAATLYSPSVYSPAALHGGPWRLPVSKQQVSMNALARTSYHT